MTHLPDDLNAILQQAQSRVGSAQKIWVTASMTYDTEIIFRRGVVLGGAVSPHLFINIDEHPNWNSVGAGMALEAPVVMAVASVAGHLIDWVPKLEAVAKMGRTLCTITDEVEQGEVLATFLINHARNVLRNAVVYSAKNRIPTKWKTTLQKAVTHDASAEIAYTRRSASAIITDDPALSSDLTDIAIIRVGGDSYTDFAERFKTLTNEVLRLSGEPPWSFGFK